MPFLRELNRQKLSFRRKLLFVSILAIVFNAVFFTALMVYYHTLSLAGLRIIILLFNLSLVPAIGLMTPIVTQRNIYQDKTLLLTLKGTTVGILIFMALLALSDVELFVPLQFCFFYLFEIAAASITTIIYRLILKRIRRRGSDHSNVIIVGDDDTAASLPNDIKLSKADGYNLVGYVGDKSNKNRMNTKWLGTFDEIEEIVERYNVDVIYQIVDGNERISKVVEMCNNKFISLYFVPKLGPLVLRKFTIPENSAGFINLSFKGERLANIMNRWIKRSFDVVVSLAAIALLAVPVFIPTAIAVKLSSPGPILFRQKRNGYHGKVFTCYKFRSMVVNHSSNEASTERNDSRITRVGRFIRKTSIDELPQFFNVLKGDMSVVGPRPHILKQTEDYRKLLDNYMIRHQIKPGITGWAQINNLRGTTETVAQMEQRVKADIWYIENWSLALDLKIVFMTAYNVLFTKEENAY